MTRKKAEKADRPPIEAASAWLGRLLSPEATPDDARAAEAWLAQDAANREAWNMVCALWSGMGELADEPEALALRAEAAAPTPRRR